jgi:hypothetical protein
MYYKVLYITYFFVYFYTYFLLIFILIKISFKPESAVKFHLAHQFLRCERPGPARIGANWIGPRRRPSEAPHGLLGPIQG